MPRGKKSKSKNVKGVNVDMNWKCSGCKGGMGCGYFLGFIGALVYFLQTSTGFWGSVLAILKAIVWPAFLIYHLFGL